MIDSAAIRTILCDAFSKEVSVNRVPCGLAISTSFVDASGDPLGFYLIETKTVSGPGYYFVDGGNYLPHLAASGIDLESGQPARLLDRILSGTGTFWDKETWEIRSTIFTEADLAPRAYRFLSALIRVRDLECLENGIEVDHFTEEFKFLILGYYLPIAKIWENTSVDVQFTEFPADFVIRPPYGRTIAVFLVTNAERLNEALLLKAEAQLLQRRDFSVVALIEARKTSGISEAKLRRAKSRLDAVIIYRKSAGSALRKIHGMLKSDDAGVA